MLNKSIRPKFRIITDEEPSKILAHIESRLQNENLQINGQVVQEHAFIRIPKKDQHYWSPELHVWVRKQADKTILYGVMGPRPKIWTMFMFFYTAVLTMASFGSSYGIIQWV